MKYILYYTHHCVLSIGQITDVAIYQLQGRDGFLGFKEKSPFVSLKILSPQCSHIQDCHSRAKSELHDDIQHVLAGLVVLPITTRVESVDVDEVSVRVPEFLSYRLDDHSLPCTVVSQENNALISRETVNQLLLFRSPE